MVISAVARACANRSQHVWPDARSDGIASAASLEVREHWMQVAISVLHNLVSPCPFAAFGTAIVNHTSSAGLGELVCLGANAVASTGNPTLHGEIAGINNCTLVLTDPSGPYGISPPEVPSAWKDLTLYTTAEPCPMCASAIRWAGFKECVFGTSIRTLTGHGWSQINTSSSHIFEHSHALGTRTRLVGGVLQEETDALFAWQFDEGVACPKGCERAERNGRMCVPVTEPYERQPAKEL